VRYELDRYTGIDLFLARLARFFIRRRHLGVILQVIIAILCIWAISTLRLRDDPNAWPPASDPLVQLNQKIMGIFGGGNSVSIEVKADSGTVYTPENLKTIKDITDSLYLVPGCIPFAVRSLSTLSSERYSIQDKGTHDESFLITPIMPQYITTSAQARDIQSWATDNPLLNGVVVSKDGKAALILADFRSQIPAHAQVETRITDPVAIYHAITEILKRHERPGITLRAAGTPIIVGWVNSVGLWYIAAAFIFFLAVIAAILWYAFRTYSGVFLPLRVAVLGVLMGFGFYRVFCGNTLYSAAALLAPFIIVAAGACHSIQFLTRFYYEEFPQRRNVEDAIVSTFVSRLRPMLVSLLCDIIPFAVMAAVPFENVRSLGIVAVFGLASLTIDEFALMIPALSSITMHELEGINQREAARSTERMDHLLASAIRRTLDSRVIIGSLLAGCFLLTAGSTWLISRATFGQDNTYAIHNYLTRSWKHSDIFLMEREIVSRFHGIYPMMVLVEPEIPKAKVLEQPAVMRGIDQLATFLSEQPHIGSVANLGYLVKLNNSFIHENSDSFLTVPDTSYEIGQILHDTAERSPGVYHWLMTDDYASAVIIAYLDSTRPETVERIMTETRDKASQTFVGLPVKVSIAGGSIGVASAFNHNVAYWLFVGGLLGLVGTFILAVLCIRSVALSLILLIPLLIGMVISVAIMYLVGIELNSNAISALAIASGIGIDSEVYLLFRVREEFAKVGNFREALVQGYVKIRRALLVSNGALILGCWALIPVPLYIGYVGFGMGLVLLFSFVMSAILSPILWWWFGEQVVVGNQDSMRVESRASA
jgi:predicted RND superfamily exporter protein